MNVTTIVKRFLLPSVVVTAYGLWRFGAQISTRAEVDIGPFLTIGRGTQISSFCKVKCDRGPLAIGARVSIGSSCFLSAHSAGIVIGDDSMIGPNSVIVAGRYRYERLDVPMHEQGEVSKGIKIGNDVWLGGNVSVMDGAEIGDHTIVMAGSVVSGRLPAGVVASGMPAKVVFQRR